jgi:catechol 2,3-dioxygenase-like lactoylglutathione lyase family enzyme
MTKLAAALVGVAIGAAVVAAGSPSRADAPKEESVELGNFSVSLAVKDLAASRAFYEKLGFKSAMGDAAQNWLILQNGTATIGLFQGMLERNTLTFNPGWTSAAKPLEKFQDVRDIQRVLKARGIAPTHAADEASKGPASLIVTDPDGNPVLIDQHVPRPGK